METILFISLIFIASILLIFALIQFIYDKVIKLLDKYKSSKITLNFSQDILYLDYITGFYINKEIYDFETLRSVNGTITNQQYKDLLDKIVKDISDSLSEEYILKLQNYFDTEALVKFIAHHVDYELIKIILKKNQIRE
jgi:homospermidine synthase